MRISEIMVRNPVSVPPDTSVVEIAKLMDNKGISSVVLVKDDQAIGIVTERDLVRRVLASGKDPNSTKVFDICTRPVATTSENADLELAVDIMNSYSIRRLVIVDRDNKVVGIVTTDDIWRNYRQLSEELAVKYMSMSRHKQKF
jgi:CBS domain-containing protein